MRRDSYAYDEFWARFFGVEVAALQRAALTVVPHAQLVGYAGIWFFQHQQSVLISAPSEWVERLRDHAAQLARQPLPGLTLLQEILGGNPGRVIGPAYHGYLPPNGFRSARDPNVRRLNPEDQPALRDLRAACSVEDWDHSALSTAHEPVFGYFVAGQLVAAAGSDPWTDDALNPGVLSRPDQRGRGFGAAAVSAVVESALAAGKLPLYQTLVANGASVRVCERLGYRPYATHLAVRLAEAADS